MTNNVKKIVVIVAVSTVLAAGLLIAAVLWFLDYSYDAMRALPDKAESFYYNNKDMLNEFVALCFEKHVVY